MHRRSSTEVLGLPGVMLLGASLGHLTVSPVAASPSAATPPDDPCACIDGSCQEAPVVECGEVVLSAEHRDATEAATECVLTALAEGRAAEVRRVVSSEEAASVSTRFLHLVGDGTLLDWSRDEWADTVHASSVERREVPALVEVRACSARADASDRWRCVERIVAATPRLATCGESMTWIDEL